MAIKDYSFLKKQKETPKETTKDYSFLIKDKTKFEEKKQQEKQKVEAPVRTVGLKDFLGGGQYKVQTPGEVTKTERDYAGLEKLSGKERDHIVSVALGGTSDKENLQYLKSTEKERQQGKVDVEIQAINDFKAGKISLGEARLKIATKNQQILGLTPTEEEQTTKGQLKKMFNPKNIINNIIDGVKKMRTEGEAKTKEIYGQATEQQKASMGLYGEKAKKEADLKKVEYLKSPEGQLKKAEQNVKEAETRAKILTAPVRFTAGSLATGLVSYGLERADSDLKFTPKTDAQKLIIGETDIQRLSKQEDLYGIVARGASIPVALTLMAVLESPFVSGTGLKPLVKEGLEKVIAKEGVEVISKLGAKEYIKLVDDIIKTEMKSGNIEKEIGEKAIKEINNFRVKEVKEVKPVVEKPKTNITQNPLEQEAKKYKSADEFIKAQGTPVYHGTPEKFDSFNLEQVGKSTDSGMFGRGIYFTDDLKEATTYSKRGNKVGEVKEVVLDLKKPYIIKTKGDIPKIDVPMNTIEQMKVADKEYSRLFTEKLQKQGYDGVIDMMTPTKKQYVVFDPSQIKTKSQLTDIWNKAQGKTPLKSSTDNLIKEAKKLNSLNPTGSVFSKYTPEQRATTELAENITTLDKTMGKSADDIITVYRGSSKGRNIVPGDFITTNKQLAKDYAGSGKILEKKVKLSDILDDTTEPLGEEYIYRPQKLKSEVKVEPITYEPLVKESSIPKRIGNEVIEKGLAKDLGELPTYEKVTFKDQAKLVGDIIDNDPELAFRIAMGEAVSPNKALPESVFIAVKNQAIKNGDVDILRQLATSEKGVAREATELGQRIKMLDERLEDDAFKNINDVVKARNSKLEKSGVKVKEVKAQEIKKIKSEITKAKPIKDDWLDFVNSIKC